MGVTKNVVCPNCGHEYAAFRSDCPNCGARNETPSERTPRSSDAVRRGTSAARKAEDGAKWQFIIGLCLIAAVIVAVVLLVTTTLSGSYDKPVVSPSPSPSAAATPTPSPSPSPTPSPTPEVTSVTINFLGQQKSEFATQAGKTTQLKAAVMPADAAESVKWSSDNEAIAKVDDTGLVTAVGSGWATITLECYGKTATCKVWVQ